MNKLFALFGLLLVLSGCASNAPMKTVSQLELDRFMGSWYVIGNIPTFIEKNAVNAIEEYSLNEDGTVATTFTFREETPDGKKRQYQPKGFVVPDTGNAVWRMQFIWPFKADYRVVYIDPDYSETIIARKARDYVWLMSRSPSMTSERFQEHKEFIRALGYDTSLFQPVLQQYGQTPGAEE